MKFCLVFNFILLLFSQGSYARSIDSLRQVLTELNNDSSELALDEKAIICNDIAIYYQGVQEQEKARTFFLQAIHFIEKKVEMYDLTDAQSFFDIGYLYGNLATFESTLMNYDRALEHMRKAELNYQKLKPLMPAAEFRGLQPRFYQTFGVIAYHAKKYEDAIAYFNTALKSVSKSTSAGAMSLRRMKGEAYSGLKKYDVSQQIFRDCLRDIEEENITSVSFHRYLRSLLAAIYNSGDYELVIATAQQYPIYNLNEIHEAIEVLTHDVASSVLDNFFIMAFAHVKLGDIHMDPSYYEKAYNWEKQGLQLAEIFTLKSDGEKLGSVIANSKNKVLSLLIAAIKLNETSPLSQQELIQIIRIIDVYQSSRLHIERLSYELNAKDWKKEKELRNELDYLTVTLDEAVAEGNDQTAFLDSLRTIIYDKSIELSQLNESTKRDKILKEYEVGQQKFGQLLTEYLNREEQDLLVYFHTEDCDSIFVLGHANNSFYIDVNAVPDTFIKEIAENYSFNSTLQFDKLKLGEQISSNQTLYNYLWSSHKDLGLRESVLVYPLHELSYVNYEALIDPQGEYLIHQHEFVYTSSLFSLLGNKVPFEGKYDFQSFYPTDYGVDSLANLFYAEKEIAALSELLKAKSFIGKAASKHNFKLSAERSKGIHVASHSILNKQHPYDSYIIFNATGEEDNKLHAYEIFSMSIQAEMIALSSCNSSQGKIEEGMGALSLANAFYFAGIPSTISSMWSAQDKSSSAIMTQFYTHLSNGECKTTSLRTAKLDYLSTHDHLQQQPFFWANYVLYGDPSPIYEKQSDNYFVYWAIAGVISLVLLLFIFYKYFKRSAA